MKRGVVLSIAIFSVLNLNCGSAKKGKVPVGCWMNSHEEDQKDPNTNLKIYRPCSYAFPAARGRSGFILKNEGEIGLIAPNSVDGRDTTWGNWVQIGSAELKISFSQSKLSRLKWKKKGSKKLIVELK